MFGEGRSFEGPHDSEEKNRDFPEENGVEKKDRNITRKIEGVPADNSDADSMDSLEGVPQQEQGARPKIETIADIKALTPEQLDSEISRAEIRLGGLKEEQRLRGIEVENQETQINPEKVEKLIKKALRSLHKGKSTSASKEELKSAIDKTLEILLDSMDLETEELRGDYFA